VKECPVCRASLADNAAECPFCGVKREPDGGDKASWEAEMARMVAERERKGERAERLGRFGRPLPHWFLDGRSGCGMITLIVAVALAACVAVVVAVVR
jgi:hypothetical protein